MYAEKCYVFLEKINCEMNGEFLSTEYSLLPTLA